MMKYGYNHDDIYNDVELFEIQPDGLTRIIAIFNLKDKELVMRIVELLNQEEIE